MGQWINKTFYKHLCIKCFVFGTDGRMKMYWAIPKNDVVIIGKITDTDAKAYHINVADRFYHKGVPSYVFNTNNTEPFNPYMPNQSVNTPDQEAVMTNAQVTRELFTAFKAKLDMMLIPVIASIVVLLALIGIAYVGAEKINEIIQRITDIETAISSGY